MDGFDYNTALELFANYPETIKHIKFMIEIRDKTHFCNYAQPRSLEYVEHELQEIVEQIIVNI